MASRWHRAKLSRCLNLLQPGLKLKKLLCLIIALGPVFAGAQALSPAIAASSPLAVPAAPRAANPGGKLEITLEQLRDRLLLKPEQQALWSAYAAKVGAYAEVFYREKPVLASQESTATHQVARLVDAMQNRLAALEEVEFAAKNLFASLSPDQQKTANQLLIATIPTLSSYAPNAPEDGKRVKSAKPDSGTRPRRGGGGGMGSGMGGGG